MTNLPQFERVKERAIQIGRFALQVTGTPREAVEALMLAATTMAAHDGVPRDVFLEGCAMIYNEFAAIPDPAPGRALRNE